MNSFGLGLVLNFVDNASAGMSNAVRVFENMQSTVDSLAGSTANSTATMLAASMALNQVGDTMIGAGSSIVNMFGAVEQSVINTGMTMQGYRMQLAALYGSTEAGEAKLDEIKQYAMSSVFDIQSLIPAITTMKAVGIEAMSEVTTSSGQHTQKLLDYASDIAAMVPNMRNAYGTGVQAAMGALKEYIAEGNALSLKRGAGLDITAILGEDKGGSIEERTQQIADLVEQLNIVGYTASLAGTPTQRLSNLEDALFNAMSRIADSGVFEAYCNLLERASNWVFELVDNEENFNAVTGVLSDTLTLILSPLEKILDVVMWIGNKLVDLSKNNPTLVKGILVLTAAFGGVLIVGGALLKLLSTLGLAFAGLQNIKLLLNPIKMLGSMAGGLIPSILPFVALATLLYEVWTHNIFGIRDTVTTVFGDLVEVIRICADAWDDNTLSEENFVRAKELGILPLIEAIMDFKYRFDFFVQGFIEGFESIFAKIGEFTGHLLEADGLVGDIAQSVGEFLKSLFGVEDSEQAWKDFGNTLGEIAAVALLVWSGIKLVVSVIRLIGKAVSFVSTLASAFNSVWSAIMWVIEGVAALLGVSVGWAAVIVAAVVAVVALIIAYWDEICAVLSTVADWIMANVITPVINFFINLMNFIVGLVAIIWEGAVAILTPIAEWVSSNIVTPVVNFFTNLWNRIVEIITNVFNSIKSILTPVGEWVNSNVVTPVVNFFTGLIDTITGIFDSIKSAITGAFSAAYDAVVGVWQGVVGFFSGIASKIGGIISGIIGKGSSITGISTIPAAAEGVDSFVGGLIQVNEKGGELITLPSGSTVIPHDESLEDSFRKGMILGAKASGSENSKTNNVPINTTQNDYSVTFSAGSIIIQVADASDRELERVAEKLMKIIERKQKLKSMAVRTKEAVLV